MLKELLYPFDAGYILAGKRRIRKRLLEDAPAYTEKRNAKIRASTTHDIKHIKELL